MKRVLSSVGVALLLTVVMLGTIAVRAPAAWLGDWLQAHTKVRLLDARGTVWHGSALVGISDGRETTLIPGRIEWNVDDIGPRRLAARVSHPWLTMPLAISVDGNGMQVKQGNARLPAGVLAGAGAPFNTLRPGGVLELAWTDTEIRGTSLKGEVQVDWRDAQSALSTVVPLGTYRLTVRGTGGVPVIDLRTLAGPLQMQGKGTVEGSRIRFNGIATAEPSMLGALNGLLGLLGMRSGDKVLLAFST
ncbi:MAG TPA: type II secretion system protein N [Burkholderiales bacterium]|nr:type II secretion system protein N [Burkholderiales bacterium]